MQPDFWHERWRSGQIGFHRSKPHRHLEDYWPSLALRGSSRVWVPLCGKSLDMLWLRDRGHAVAGVEISAVALESFLMEHGIPARRRVAAEFDLYEAGGLQLMRGDIFALTRERLGEVAAVYDRAALVSFAPELRDAYVERVADLTAAGTQTLLVTMEYPQKQTQGPPFSVSAAEVRRLYGRHHAIQELSRQDILADEPRLRAKGVTQLHEVCYRMQRL
jgi:thiopurine S-methyltransferase